MIWIGFHIGCLPDMNGCSNPTNPQDPSSPTYTVGDKAAYLIHQGPSHSTSEVTRQIFGRLNGDLTGDSASMSGFIDSYASVYNNATLGPEIMQCFALEHVPVIFTLAQEFALFDGWFSSVPGCTMYVCMYVYNNLKTYTENKYTTNTTAGLTVRMRRAPPVMA